MLPFCILENYNIREIISQAAAGVGAGPEGGTINIVGRGWGTVVLILGWPGMITKYFHSGVLVWGWRECVWLIVIVKTN